MTFDEWYEKHGLPLVAFAGHSHKDTCRRAWDAAMAEKAEGLRRSDEDSNPLLTRRFQ